MASALSGYPSQKINGSSKIEEMLSVSSIDEIDTDWIMAEILALEAQATEKISVINGLQKEKLVEKVKTNNSKAAGTSRILRVLLRLAMANNDSRQLCHEILSNLSNLTTQTSLAESVDKVTPTFSKVAANKPTKSLTSPPAKQ